MKNKHVLLVLFSILLSACFIDNKPPNLTLIGDEILEIPYGSLSTDPGATASDNRDGNIDEKVMSNWSSIVDINKVGAYTVTYTVSDRKENKTTINRKVIVRYFSDNFKGQYNTVNVVDGMIGSTNGTCTIYSGTSANDFYISQFTAFAENILIQIGGEYGDKFSFNHTDVFGSIEGSGYVDGNPNIIKFQYRRVYSGSFTEYGTFTLTKL